MARRDGEAGREKPTQFTHAGLDLVPCSVDEEALRVHTTAERGGPAETPGREAFIPSPKRRVTSPSPS